MVKLRIRRRIVSLFKGEKEEKEKGKMRLVSLWLTTYQYEMLREFVEKGYFVNLSEAVRFAINEMIREVAKLERHYRDMVRVGR